MFLLSEVTEYIFETFVTLLLTVLDKLMELSLNTSDLLWDPSDTLLPEKEPLEQRIMTDMTTSDAEPEKERKQADLCTSKR